MDRLPATRRSYPEEHSATAAFAAFGAGLTRKRRPAAPALRRLGLAATLLAAAALYVQAKARAADRDNPAQGQFVDVDGVRLHYVERGEGAPLVLLHGNGSMIRELELSGVIDLAARHYRVIAFDRPGFGDSERPAQTEWTAEAQAALIAAALTKLDVDKATVLGHAWGTLVALALALDHPERVRGLVLVSGYYFPTFRPDAYLLAAPAWPGVGWLMRHTTSPLASRMLWPLFVRAAFGPPETPADIARLPKWKFLHPSRLHAAGSESAMLSREARELSTRYAELAMPVVILAGGDDRVVNPRRHAHRLHEAVPHSELVIVPRGGHMLHHFAPRRVLAAIHRVTEPDRTLDELPAATPAGESPPVTAGLAD